MDKVKSPVAWRVDVQKDMGGSTLMIAEPVFESGGEWHGAMSSARGNPFEELEDFRVSMYVRSYSNHTGEVETPFGLEHEYVASRVRLRQAEHMVKVLRKLDRRLGELSSSEGYIGQADFAGYLVRVGRVLGISKFRVRNTAEGYRITGEYYRTVDAASLQYWVKDRVGDAGAALRV